MSNSLLCCTVTHVLVPIYVPQTLSMGICLDHWWLRAGRHTLFRGPTWGNSVSPNWQLKSRERIGGREGVHEGEWTRKAEFPCDHISSVCPVAHFDLRRITATRPLITINVTATPVCSWIWSRSDYCNFLGIASEQMDRLQRIKSNQINLYCSSIYKA